jgi:hypothetical protein
MLRTDERALLVDLLTPPEAGFRLERAVGTTFTMQMESLLRVPLAVVGSEWHDGVDPLGVMEAVRSSAGRIDAFCQAGMVSVPSTVSPLLAFLEDVVHQVVRPRPGHLFHPKLWLASFTGPAQERRFRLLCGSRNLTGDRAWDAVVGLDGVDAGPALDVNEPLAGFIESLPGRVPGGMDASRARAVADLGAAVRRAVWEPPDGCTVADWLRFHWIDGERPLRSFDGADRRLVVSPFLNRDGVERVWPDGTCSLVSRPESFAGLGAEYLEELAGEWAADFYELDDSAALPDEDDDDAGIRWSLRGLHAKVLIEERGKNAHVLVGSANATGAAWGGNTEFMVEVVGPRRRLGVDAVLADVDGGFRRVLRPIDPAVDPEQPDEPTLHEQLERALVDVAAVAFRASAVGDTGGWREEVSTDSPIPGPFPGDATLTVRLLTSGDTRTASSGSPLTASWAGLAGEDVTPYLVLELVAGSTRASCVAVATLTGGPGDRVDRLIARQVGSPEAFLRFLMLLLQLGRGDEGAVAALLAGPGRGGVVDGFFANSAGVLEALVVALCDHPATLDEVDRLVQRLSATEEGRAVLPAGWNDLWAAVTAARQQLGAGRT